MNTAGLAERSRAPRWSAPLELSACAALGALQSLSFVNTHAWWLQTVAVGLLAWRVAAAAPLRAAALGFAFGTAWLVAGTWWLFISMHRYGGLPAWMAALAVLLLAALLSLYLAVALACFARWRARKAGRDALLFAALWLLAELARGVLFTGFPWVAAGYAHVDGPLSVLAPWIGVYGIGCASAAIGAWFALRCGRGLRAGALPALVLMLTGLTATWVGPAQFTTAGGTLSVALLQGNVAQNEKFSLEYMPQALAWTSVQMLGARARLVVGPETVIPLLPAQLDPHYWQPLLARFQRGTQAALIGLPLGDEQQGYTNSAAGISALTISAPGGFYRYDKQHLVPFGEFIPLGFRWFTNLMNIPLGDFNRGPLVAPSFTVLSDDEHVERVAPNICYEDLFGEELAARFIDRATAPTLLANLSNIGWFGATIAVEQHLQISRMRSLELQRPMLRATNTGATAVIDHRGQVRHALPAHTQGVLEGSVQGRDGLTPFAWWAARLGLWPAVIFALLSVALSMRRRVGPDVQT